MLTYFNIAPPQSVLNIQAEIRLFYKRGMVHSWYTEGSSHLLTCDLVYFLVPDT